MALIARSSKLYRHERDYCNKNIREQCCFNQTAYMQIQGIAYISTALKPKGLQRLKQSLNSKSSANARPRRISKAAGVDLQNMSPALTFRIKERCTSVFVLESL